MYLNYVFISEGITVPSVDSDKCSDTVPPDVLEPMTPKSRRSRFAALAKNISNWEDDLSHPHIKYLALL